MLIPRIITALILAIAVIWAVFSLSLELFSIAVWLVLLLGLLEWSRLCKQSRLQFVFSALLLTFLVASFVYHNQINPAFFLGASLMLWLYKLFTLGKSSPVSGFGCVLESVGALFLAWVGMVMLKASTGNEGALLMLSLIIVWSADTFAYFGGKRFGKTKLAPSISPGKTREGVFSGACGAVLVALIYAALFLPQVNSFTAYASLALITIFVALISVVGDLSESKLKRAAGAKDSGKLLPGHGGILDRIDGLIAGVPIFTFYWWLLIQQGIVAS